jgi:hypothetical protein
MKFRPAEKSFLGRMMILVARVTRVTSAAAVFTRFVVERLRAWTFGVAARVGFVEDFRVRRWGFRFRRTAFRRLVGRTHTRRRILHECGNTSIGAAELVSRGL